MRLKQVQLGIKKITLAGIGSLEKKRLEDHRQRIPKNVIRRYLERSMQKKFFPTYIHYK